MGYVGSAFVVFGRFTASAKACEKRVAIKMILHSISGLVLAVVLGGGAALYPAVLSALLDSQKIIFHGELD